jgi:hypothetical protein
MIIITNDEWVADLRTMICRNTNTRMVIEFQRDGTTYTGKIKEIPFELMTKWTKTKHGKQLIKKAVMEAEKVLWRAQIESNIENLKKRNNICYQQ